jgi:cytochrome c
VATGRAPSGAEGGLALAFALVLPAIGLPGAAHSATVFVGDPVAGKALYEARCGGCHSVDANRIGPLHRNVVGRVPGSVPGFAYSPALSRLGGVWTAERLDLWLQGPQKLAPGVRMYLSVSDPVERHNVVAYLQTVSRGAGAR